MTNSDPRFRSVIANLEKASTGEALREALVKVEESNLGPVISDHMTTSSTESAELSSAVLGFSGALPTLYHSHTMNINNLTDQTWFLPPVIGPGDVLIDFNPDYKYIDQDGNELHF